MPEPEAVKDKTPSAHVSQLIGIVDKLTDPIEQLIAKIASGRFLMAVITTWFICDMSAGIAMKYPDLAPVIVSSMFSTWGAMVGFYFGSRPAEVDKKKKEQTP